MGLHKLHQNVWQRVSGLCPDPLGTPREGREKRRTDRERGGLRPGRWTPRIYDRSLPLSGTGTVDLTGHSGHVPLRASANVLVMMDQELSDAAAYASGRRHVCNHQVVALFCVK